MASHGRRDGHLDPDSPPPYLGRMEFLLGVAIFLIAVALLSLGTLLFRRPLQGSCGGVATAMGENGGTCDVCGRAYDDCPEKEQAS